MAKKLNPIERALANADKIIAANNDLERLSRTGSFKQGAAPRGRILTDPAEIRALRDEKRRADTDY